MNDNAGRLSVFINCPFDEDYAPILQAILFCLIYLRFSPRIATESEDSGDNRLERICSLIAESDFSIHDLSRCQSTSAGEYYRLNMPFELGIDYGHRLFSSDAKKKSFLILEELPHRYRASLSDMSGCDIKSHSGDFQKAVRSVRNWIVSETGEACDGAGRILNSYYDFQAWHYERQIERGFSEDDIQDYPTVELLHAMQDWMAKGRPL